MASNVIDNKFYLSSVSYGGGRKCYLIYAAPALKKKQKRRIYLGMVERVGSRWHAFPVMSNNWTRNNPVPIVATPQEKLHRTRGDACKAIVHYLRHYDFGRQTLKQGGLR